MLPVSAVQAFLLEVVDFPEESTLVVVYWQVQVTFTSVEPETVAVNVSDCETMTELDDGLTETVTTFVLLPPPHPATARTRAPRLSKSVKLNLRDFITTRTPKIPLPAAIVAEKVLSSISPVYHPVHLNLEKNANSSAGQNVRLTVKRNVVFGSK